MRSFFYLTPHFHHLIAFVGATTMKSIVYILTLSSLFAVISSLIGCTQDACKTNPPSCKSDATCYDGKCLCPDGFAGTDCGDTLRDPFLLRKKLLPSSTNKISFRDSATTYRGVETNLSVTPNTSDSITVTISSVAAYNKIAILNFGDNASSPYSFEALVGSGTTFSVASAILTPTTYMKNVSGKLVGKELSATYSTQSNVPGVAPVKFTFKGLKLP